MGDNPIAIKAFQLLCFTNIIYGLWGEHKERVFGGETSNAEYLVIVLADVSSRVSSCKNITIVSIS